MIDNGALFARSDSNGWDLSRALDAVADELAKLDPLECDIVDIGDKCAVVIAERLRERLEEKRQAPVPAAQWRPSVVTKNLPTRKHPALRPPHQINIP